MACTSSLSDMDTVRDTAWASVGRVCGCGLKTVFGAGGVVVVDGGGGVVVVVVAAADVVFVDDDDCGRIKSVEPVLGIWIVFMSAVAVSAVAVSAGSIKLGRYPSYNITKNFSTELVLS